MNFRSITILLVSIATALTVAAPGSVYGMQTLSGVIQGFNCLIAATTCPKDTMDPHLMLESDFVLVLENGDYYLLPNLSREVKVKYLGKQAKVSGTINDQYRAIMVDSLEIKEGSEFMSVWSAKMMREELMKRINELYPDH